MSQQPPIFISRSYPNTLPRQRLSKAAITGLICGCLIFVPLVTGLAALTLGVAGIASTRSNLFYGRRWAVVGMVLGALNLIAWGGIGYWWIQTSPQRQTAYRFIDALSEGKVGEATLICTSDISAQSIQGAAEQFRNWGRVKSRAVSGPLADNEDGLITASLSGYIIWGDKGNRPVSFKLIFLDGAWKIRDFEFERHAIRSRGS